MRAATGNRAALGFAILVPLLAACYCGEERLGPYERATTSDAYSESTITTNTEIESVSWRNRTTGQSGDGVITYPYYACIMLAGCGDWLRYEYSVPLAPGFNRVEVDFEDSECWHTVYEYHVTRQSSSP